MAQEAPAAKGKKPEPKKPITKGRAPVRLRSAPAAPQPAASLADEYEHNDSQFDPDLDTPSEPQSAAVPPAPAPESAPPAPLSSRPRDPETGQFVPAEPKPEKSPRLIRQAARLGFSTQEIQDLSAEELETRVEAIHEHVLREHQQATYQRDVRQATQPRTFESDPDNRPLIGEPDARRPDEFRLFEEEDQLHPDIVSGTKKLHGLITAQEKRIKALEDMVQQLGQREMARVNETRNQTIDRVFNSLNEYQDVLGQGNYADLKAKAPDALSRRIAVLAIAEREMKDKKISLEQALRDTVKTLYPRGSKPEPASNGNRISPEQWEQAALAAPTHRDSEEPKGERRAAKAVARFLREKGENLDEFGGTEESSLPE